MPLVQPVVTRASKNLADSRQRVIKAFKDWINAAPSIVENYDLDLTTPAVRARIRQEFEKHRNVQDVNVIDRLIFKSRTEYEETINMWKQKTHVMRYFEDDVKLLQSVKPVSFLDKFLAGRED
ncbi:MAG: hypothetical protein SGCHY_003931 [Lobulomycetales sp.]